jgi:phenylpropionate dioxygenase-like ring-hydroxylating dioxygenase large terminal subunit
MGTTTKISENFNNPDVILQSWYVVAKSKEVKPLCAKTFDVLKRKIAIYRDDKGKIHALDAQCPHLGADLGLGKVIGCKLQCPFHHWTVDEKGDCFNASSEPARRKSRVYPSQEKYGHIWIFNGPKPLFEIPEPPKDMEYFILKTPPQLIKCHPHIVTANGMDVTHFDALHGLNVKPNSKLTVTMPYKLTVEMEGYPKSKLLQKIVGSNKKKQIKVRSNTIGGHMAWLEVLEPIRYYVLFTARHSNDNGAITNVFFFAPRGWKIIQSLVATHFLLHDDRKVLDTIDFHPSFSDQDKALIAYYKIINSMESW